MDSIVDRLKKDKPLFHIDGKGNLISWNSNMNLLVLLEEYLEPEMRSIEIGAGYSTVVFLHNRCFHTCIVPSEDEVNRIKDYCRSVNISLDTVKFMIGRSQDLLPVSSNLNCNIVLIDGAHRFPFPLVDWFYCANLLREGGLVVIDDTDIISVYILLKFMLNDSHWEKVETRENFAVFKKLGGHDYPCDWSGQPFSKNKIHCINDFIKVFSPVENELTNLKEDKENTQFEENESVPSNILISSRTTLPLSVIICTYNRAEFLKMTLKSLIGQTLDKKDYEIILINDGSDDHTVDVVSKFSEELPIKYFYQRNAGLPSAKNHGIYAGKGEIVFFFDDDDIATPTLLEEHVKFHRKYPEDNYAVLNYTCWSPKVTVTPLMHYLTDIGCFLFSYPHIKHGDILDYTNFWGGRSSCKRSFLIEYGVFNPAFRLSHTEDIELGYRLSKHGLKVVYNAKAVSMMVRPLTFDDFCQRTIKQGRTRYLFSTFHNNPEVHKYTEVIGVEDEWHRIRPIYNAKIRSARELDKIANMKAKYGFALDDLTKRLLHEAYWWAYKACKTKGILEAKEDSEQKLHIDNNSKSDNSQTVILCNEVKSSTETDLPRQIVEPPQFETHKITSYEHYVQYASEMRSEHNSRKKYETSLILDSKPFTTKGCCYVCKQKVEFSVDYSHSNLKNGLLIPNFRELLVCPVCGLNNRMRASIHLFEQELNPHKDSQIYITEQITPLFRLLADNYPNVIGSEYLGNTIPFGNTNSNGLRNENLTELSFSNNQFDFILSFDVFEHIPYFKKAFRECLRVLKPGGMLFFSVPFDINFERNIVRAIMKDSKTIEHLLPPEYHGDPLNSEGCLSFHIFGWEMLKQLKEINFSDVKAYLYWSKEFGYLGGEQSVFVAEKNK